jgi:hypothetical protein
MEVIRNGIIPVKGFRAVNLFGVLFVRRDAEINSSGRRTGTSWRRVICWNVKFMGNGEKRKNE